MSFLNKLKERTQQVQAALEDAATGERVPLEVHDERLNLCLGCEHLFQPTQSCKKCGCFVRAKTWLPSQNCPIGKWTSIQIQKNN